MQTRTLKELYQILLDNFDNFNDGICSKIHCLYWFDEITYKELKLLDKHFKNQKPTIFSKFFWYSSYNKMRSGDNYWWKFNESGNKQRKLFIQHLMSKL